MTDHKTKAAATPADAPATQAAVSVTVTYYGGQKLVSPNTVQLTDTHGGLNYYGGLVGPDVLTLAGA